MKSCQCPNCGANLLFENEAQAFAVCEYCGAKIAAPEDSADQRAADETRQAQAEAERKQHMQELELKQRETARQEQERTKRRRIRIFFYIFAAAIALTGLICICTEHYFVGIAICFFGAAIAGITAKSRR